MLRVIRKKLALGLGVSAALGGAWHMALAREGDFRVTTGGDPVLTRAVQPSVDGRSTSRKPGLQLAHAIMTRTLPEQGATAIEGLAKIEIWYDSAVRDNMLALAVTDANGVRVDNRDPKVDPADQTHVFASVQPLAPGSYTIRYRAISVDSFLATGVWNLTVVAKPQSVGQLIKQ
jgi:methionine-rich copper-binding protein CopC